MTILGLVVLGLAAGAFAASLGVGGGVIFVPALVVFFSFVQQDAQGTSLAVILPTTIVGTIVHHRHGRVVWEKAIPIGMGGIVGAVLGSRIALALDPAVLRRLFATLLMVLVIRLLVRSVRERSPKEPDNPEGAS